MTCIAGSFQARPTEYLGIVFRSKSEAVLARALKLVGWFWEYEPVGFQVGGWIPDFWAVAPMQSPGVRGWRLVSAIIEYKPREVTPTYLSELESNFTQLNHRTIRESCCLISGTPFDTSVPRVAKRFTSSQGWVNAGCFDSVLSRLDEAVTYRFDLNHNGAPSS